MCCCDLSVELCVCCVLQVSKERIRVEDFMRDYDKLRCGRMLKTSFRRAVNLARLDLYESELAAIEDK